MYLLDYLRTALLHHHLRGCLPYIALPYYITNDSTWLPIVLPYCTAIYMYADTIYMYLRVVLL